MVKITWPSCAWCGAADPRVCRVCGIMTCWECVKYPKPDDCTHSKYVPPKGDNWDASLTTPRVGAYNKTMGKL